MCEITKVGFSVVSILQAKGGSVLSENDWSVVIERGFQGGWKVVKVL